MSQRDDRQNRERRTFRREIRVLEDDDGPRIVGYAAVFDEWSDDLGWFRERIRPGAFAKTIGESDVRALWNHDRNMVLGRTASGTLELREDEVGLRYEVRPPDTQWARDALVTMRRGDVDQSSFGFETIRDEWSGDGENQERTLIEVRLWDVSPVTFAAYPQTSAQVRARYESGQETAEGDNAAPILEDHPAVDDSGDDERARARLDLLRRRVELEELCF